MSGESEPTTTTGDGLFWAHTKILDHLVAGSDFDALLADDAWVSEDGLVPLLAVCRDRPDLQDVADELGYVQGHLGDDVIHGRRVYVTRTPAARHVELIALSDTTDDVLIVTPDPLGGVRVVERGVGATRSPVLTYVNGKRVPQRRL